MKTTLLTIAAIAMGCVPSQADSSKSPPPKPATPNGPREVAILGAGCFWGVEAWMAKAPGIVDIDVGYAGGASAKASYEQVSAGTTGHAEAVKITFDPSVISYEDLLAKYFFRMHDPTTKNRQGNDVGTQYRSAIFPLTPAQQTVAKKVVARVDGSHKWNSPVSTTIEPNPTWVKAEEYHQDYLVKHPGGYDNHYFRDFSF